jgi:hypothetical protein
LEGRLISFLFKTANWRSNFREINQWIIGNPAVTVLAGILIVVAYEYHQERNNLRAICGLTGSHDQWVDEPKTRKEKITDICLGRDPGLAEHPQNP